jgi:midasin
MLTEDNKHIVNHLKSRKRKLFADTLKEIRQMGFRSNHSTDILTRQASLSAVLSTIPALQNLEKDGDIRAADYYLHKFLDVMPAVRSATKDHSDELATTEVIRSIGYIEGLLPFDETKRNVSGSYSKTLALDRTVVSLQNLWRPQDYSIHGSERRYETDAGTS